MAKTKGETKMISTNCPACDTRIRFDEQPELFDVVNCPECEDEFEVIRLSPIRLDWSSANVDEVEWSDHINEYLFDDRGRKSSRFIW